MQDTLEKVRRLEQYLSVDSSIIDPIFDRIIDKLLERESKRMVEIKSRLTKQLKEFETHYSLQSDVFYNRYENGEMGDETDFMEWAATMEMLANIDRRLTLLNMEPPS